jgi:hypothetical protein
MGASITWTSSTVRSSRIAETTVPTMSSCTTRVAWERLYGLCCQTAPMASPPPNGLHRTAETRTGAPPKSPGVATTATASSPVSATAWLPIARAVAMTGAAYGRPTAIRESRRMQRARAPANSDRRGINSTRKEGVHTPA